MNKDDLKKRIDTKVPDYIRRHIDVLDFVPVNYQHVINIGKQILYDKFDIMSGGGFVKAFNNNDLHGVYSRADKDLVRHIKLYVKMVNNIDLYN